MREVLRLLLKGRLGTNRTLDNYRFSTVQTDLGSREASGGRIRIGVFGSRRVVP